MYTKKIAQLWFNVYLVALWPNLSEWQHQNRTRRRWIPQKPSHGCPFLWIGIVSHGSSSNPDLRLITWLESSVTPEVEKLPSRHWSLAHFCCTFVSFDRWFFDPSTPKFASIGPVISRIGSTDIGLATLNENVVFQNQTFSSTESQGGRYASRGLETRQTSSLVSVSTWRTRSLVPLMPCLFMLDCSVFHPPTPISLHVGMAGLGLGSSRCCAYTSKGERYRSALFDEDGNVVSFFNFIETGKNIGISVSAYELVKAGYSLVTHCPRDLSM